jgi:hypothetical protein
MEAVMPTKDALNKSKQRRTQMRATRSTLPRYENKALVSQQMHEIKSSLPQRELTLFNEKYNELADDPCQQECFVGWYRQRLRKGIVC